MVIKFEIKHFSVSWLENHQQTVAWDAVSWLLEEAGRDEVQFRHLFIGGHAESTKFANFTLFIGHDLPETKVAFWAKGDEAAGVWEVFYGADFFTMYCEAAVELAELGDMEKENCTFVEAQ